MSVCLYTVVHREGVGAMGAVNCPKRSRRRVARRWGLGTAMAPGPPGHARWMETSVPGERMFSSECFLLFPTKFLFSRTEAITFACVFSK